LEDWVELLGYFHQLPACGSANVQFPDLLPQALRDDACSPWPHITRRPRRRNNGECEANVQSNRELSKNVRNCPGLVIAV
jgi:hypothetical protein